MAGADVKSTFLTHEVVVLTGFSKYMLDYLAREDIFCPSHRADGIQGNARRYSFEDVVLLRALKTICAGKGQIRHLTKSLRNYRRTFGPLKPGQRIEEFLVVQGNKLCAYDTGEGSIDLITGQRTLSFVVDLSVICREVARNLVVDTKSNAVRLTTAARLKANSERERVWAPVRQRRAEAKAKAG